MVFDWPILKTGPARQAPAAQAEQRARKASFPARNAPMLMLYKAPSFLQTKTGGFYKEQSVRAENAQGSACARWRLLNSVGEMPMTRLNIREK